MAIRLTLPHGVPEHWENVKTALSKTAKWTPHSFVAALDANRTSSYKAVKPMTSEERFKGLLNFFQDPADVSGWASSSELWGGCTFIKQPTAKIKGWFFAHTLPFIVKKVLDLPSTFPATMDWLVTRENEREQKIELTKEQCCSILACSFLCALHTTAAPKKKCTNCDGIFISLNQKCPQNLAKLCMLMNYFERCRVGRYLTDTPVTIYRYQSLSPLTMEQWLASNEPLQPLTLNTTGFISDAGHTALEVDFANRWIGGGVLNRGAVQEEILFSVNPELMVTIFLCGVMESNEAIVITGTEQFSLSTGYSRGLQFAGDAPLLTTTPTHVAMDAVNVNRSLGGSIQHAEGDEQSIRCIQPSSSHLWCSRINWELGLWSIWGAHPVKEYVAVGCS
eukprot:sb/3465481/